MSESNGFSEVFYTAKRFCDAGVSVLPIKTDGSKGPKCNSWEPMQRGILTSGQLLQMFHRGGPVGIGVVCGKVSGNLELIDVDQTDLVQPFIEAVESIAPGLLAKVTHIKTPRPGGHFIYRCPSVEIPGNTKLARSETQATLIETRGEGGYFLAPGCPSACHPTGRLYQHVSGPPLDQVSSISAEERGALWRVASFFNKYIENVPATHGKSDSNRNGSLLPGDDFNARATWEQILEPHGWQCGGGAGLTRWRRPGKDRGVSATTGCKSKNGNDLLCCFSSNAQPFEGASGSGPCTAYSKFAAYALLNHGGDFSAAAVDLLRQGYGEKLPAWCGLKTHSIAAVQLVPEKPRASATKITVPIEIRLNGKPIDQRSLTDSDSNRKKFVAAVVDHLGAEGVKHRGEIEQAVAGILVDAKAAIRHAREAAQSDDIPDVRTIVEGEVRKWVDFVYAESKGKAFDRMANRAFSRNQFIERFTNNHLLALASAGKDAPRNDKGDILRKSLLGLVEDELRLLWGDLTRDLAGVEHADLGPASEAAKKFKAAVMLAWTKLDTWSINRHPVSGARPGEGISLQLSHRGSLISTVRSALQSPAVEVGPNRAGRNGWTPTKEAREAWYRRVETESGQPTAHLAMRFELLGQLSIAAPEGVVDQKSFRLLGVQYGVFAESMPDVPDRLNRGTLRIAILNTEIVEELLGVPDTSDDAAELGDAGGGWVTRKHAHRHRHRHRDFRTNTTIGDAMTRGSSSPRVYLSDFDALGDAKKINPSSPRKNLSQNDAKKILLRARALLRHRRQ